MPPLEATQDASASVSAFRRWMASRCLGIITFVASARRAWRSIIYCAFAAALTAVLMLGLALHSARVVLHETCCAAQARSWAIYMLALALGSNAFEALLVPAAFAP